MPITLLTARYQAVRPGMGVPVRTTVGAPRFPLKVTLRHHVQEVTPDRWFLRSPRPDYLIAYRRKLDTVGVDRLAGIFQRIVDAESDPRLVLLCFDDLTAAGGWCHRTMFAEWWTENTGDPVRELGPAGPDPYTQGELL